MPWRNTKPPIEGLRLKFIPWERQTMNALKELDWSAACLILALLLILAGCADSGTDTMSPQPDDLAGKEYPITGRVVAVGDDKQSVTLDHEEIPGLMPGMEMKFSVDDPAIVTGIEPEDRVQGRIFVKDGSYVIRELKKL